MDSMIRFDEYLAHLAAGLECVSTRERGHDQKRGLFALADTTDVAGPQT